MYRANFMAQALAIRPGESRVELVYRPTSFVVGAWVSGLAWIVLIGGIGLASVRRRMERS